MGRKRSSEPHEKRKPVNVRPIERKHAGKVVEPYRIMEDLIRTHHEQLEQATILLCWRRGWKPDVDKVLTLARMKKASDLDKALGSRFGDSYDFVMQLNEDAWAGLSDEQKLMVVDHELCHAAPDLDRDGNQKLDARERLCWRCRKHPIQEFPEIIERYGVEVALRMNITALEAAEKATMPLFAGESSGNGKAGSDCPIEALQLHNKKITNRQIQALTDAGFDTVGKLVQHMREHGEWWPKAVRGIGKDTRGPIEDAVAEIQAG